ncbi:MAG: hypothetical protein GVY27_06355 [Deinococcus-Thermus bacterium]|jgi:hypothetical protein|nr:hypothetical protein [Deinococcota bacterium]
MSHRITTTAWNGVQDGPGPRPPGSAPRSARPAPRILVASVEPFALWAHRWGRLDAVLAAPDATAPDATAVDTAGTATDTAMQRSPAAP